MLILIIMASMTQEHMSSKDTTLFETKTTLTLEMVLR
jgi:hypothetical protein